MTYTSFNPVFWLAMLGVIALFVAIGALFQMLERRRVQETRFEPLPSDANLQERIDSIIRGRFGYADGIH